MEHTESYSGSARVYPEDQTEVPAGDHNTFRDAAQDVTKDAQRRGQEVLNKVADEAQTFVGRVRGEATGALGEGKAQLASQVGGVARALRASSREFRSDKLTGLANLSEGLAEEVEAVHRYLDERNSESLLTDFRTFANRNRGLFVGSLFLAGLVAVRFAQSTPPDAPVATRRAKTTVVTGGRVYRAGRS